MKIITLLLLSTFLFGALTVNLPNREVLSAPSDDSSLSFIQTDSNYYENEEMLSFRARNDSLSADQNGSFLRQNATRTLPFGRTLQWPKTLPYGKMHHSARMPADKTPLMARIAVRMAAKTPPCGPPSPRMPLRTLRFSDKTRARMRPKMGHLDKMPRCTRMPHKTLASCKTPARTPRRMQASSDKMQARMRLCFKMPPKTRL